MPPSPPPSPHPSPSAPPRPESPVDGSEDPAGTQPPSTPPASPPSFQDVYPPATGFADWCPTRSYVGRLVANPMGPRPIVQATLEVIPLLADIIEALPTTYNWYSSRWDKAAIPILGEWHRHGGLIGVCECACSVLCIADTAHAAA